ERGVDVADGAVGVPEHHADRRGGVEVDETTSGGVPLRLRLDLCLLRDREQYGLQGLRGKFGSLGLGQTRRPATRDASWPWCVTRLLHFSPRTVWTTNWPVRVPRHGHFRTAVRNPATASCNEHLVHRLEGWSSRMVGDERCYSPYSFVQTHRRARTRRAGASCPVVIPARRPDRAAYRPVAVTQTETTAHTVRTAEVPEDGSKAVPTVRVQDQSQANAAPLR